jgi:adenine specific DNA methylase Mod
MPRKRAKVAKPSGAPPQLATPNSALVTHGRPSAVLDTRIIYCGDCLDQLRKLPDACVDLIYIDPPFNSNRNYEVFWGETKEKRAFEDRHASTAAYIDYMRPRCVELARVLKKTGSFYYHCDWHANAYVRVMLDQILAENSFQNEIVWKRTTGHRDSHRWNQSHDTLLFYAPSEEFTWNPQYQPYTEEYIQKNFRQQDADGRRFMADNLLAAGTRKGESGKPWHGIDPTLTGNHWQYTVAKLDELDKQGRIYWPPKGTMPRINSDYSRGF